MRPRRANRDQGRAADETAEREASDYAQAVFNQHKYGPRATQRIPWSTVAATADDTQAHAMRTLTPVTEWRTSQPAPTPIEIVPDIGLLAPVEASAEVEVSPTVEVLPVVVTEPIADEAFDETPEAEPEAESEPSNLIDLRVVPASNDAPPTVIVGTESRNSDRTLLSVALGVGGLTAATIFSRRRRRRV